MIEYLHSITKLFVCISILTRAASSRDLKPRNGITKKEITVTNQSFTDVNDYDNNAYRQNIREPYEINKGIEKIHLDIENPDFRELTLILRGNNDEKWNKFNTRFNCKDSETCDVAKSGTDTYNTDNKKSYDISQDKAIRNMTTNHDHKPKFDEKEVKAIKKILGNLKKVIDPSNKLRCEGKDCVIINDRANENSKNFKQEAIDDWTKYSKDHCAGHKCEARTNAEENKETNSDKMPLRYRPTKQKIYKIRDMNLNRGTNPSKYDKRSEAVERKIDAMSLNAEDIFKMFEHLLETYAEKLTAYIKNAEANNIKIALLSFDDKTIQNFETLKRIYHENPNKISDDLLTAAIRYYLRNIIRNRVMYHNFSNSNIFVSREMFEDVDWQKLENMFKERWDFRKRSVFPMTKLQKLKMSRPIKFHTSNYS